MTDKTEIRVMVNSGGLDVDMRSEKSCHYCKHVEPIQGEASHPTCGNADCTHHEKDVRRWNTCDLWEAE